MPLTFSLVRLKIISVTHFLTETLDTLLLSRRKKKLQINTQERLVCLTNVRFRKIKNLQTHTSLSYFLAREKMIYKIMPRSLISRLGKK